RAGLGEQVEVEQPGSGIVDEVLDACPRGADLRLRAGKSVQTKQAFTRGKHDARGERTGITHAVDAIPAVRYELARIAQEAHTGAADRHDDPIGAIRGSGELERLRRLQVTSMPVEGIVGEDRTTVSERRGRYAYRARLGCLSEGEDV